MDTSKEYILQCEKAVEIQKLHKMNTGDCYYQTKDDSDYCEGAFTCWNGLRPNAGYHDYDSWWYFPDDCIWLPKQDQLQEMVKTEKYGCDKNFWLLEDFMRWRNKYAEDNASMEQLWLAFVMKEKYSKTWNGTDWEVLT